MLAPCPWYCASTASTIRLLVWLCHTTLPEHSFSGQRVVDYKWSMVLITLFFASSSQPELNCGAKLHFFSSHWASTAKVHVGEKQTRLFQSLSFFIFRGGNDLRFIAWSLPTTLATCSKVANNRNSHNYEYKHKTYKAGIYKILYFILESTRSSEDEAGTILEVFRKCFPKLFYSLRVNKWHMSCKHFLGEGKFNFIFVHFWIWNGKPLWATKER